MIRIDNLRVHFSDESSLEQLSAKRLGIPVKSIAGVSVVRKTLDARRYRGAPIQYKYVVDVEITGSEKKLLARFRSDKEIGHSDFCHVDGIEKLNLPLRSSLPPIVVGFGPAGMFAALALARNGMRPIVLERGQDVDSRHDAVQRFWRGNGFDDNSNVQFGEGGAGTFSDGKLTTRVNDPAMMQILAELVRAGAPSEIMYLHKPHVGTDLLRGIVKKIREEIIGLGGEVRFSSKVTDIEISAGAVSAVVVNGDERIAAEAVFMGIGHSARDTYAMLDSLGVPMEAKPFAIGVRIEHPQDLIDKSQYGADFGKAGLPVSDYSLAFNDKESGRACYSFCMCPGGKVVAAASERGGVVTNGMSDYGRDTGVANSALVVTVSPNDFGSGVLDGVLFQRKWEQAAFKLGGCDYKAPIQTVGDFISGRKGSSTFTVNPSYMPGVKPVNLHGCLPKIVTDMLENALPYFGSKIKGFDDKDVPMIGVETRTSAPCRILRDKESGESEGVSGLYPIGEGAGYAGGIMSAALDGLRSANKYMQKQSENGV